MSNIQLTKAAISSPPSSYLIPIVQPAKVASIEPDYPEPPQSAQQPLRSKFNQLRDSEKYVPGWIVPYHREIYNEDITSIHQNLEDQSITDEKKNVTHKADEVPMDLVAEAAVNHLLVLRTHLNEQIERLVEKDDEVNDEELFYLRKMWKGVKDLIEDLYRFY